MPPPPPHKRKRWGTSDDYDTCPSALRPLIPYLPRNKVIWEPACGTGRLVRGLEEAGFEVVGTDKRPRNGYRKEDFYLFRPVTDFERSDPNAMWEFFAPALKKPLGEVIVTNPPYSLKDDWLDICYALKLPFALLLPLDALEGKRRQELYRKHGLQLLPLTRRAEFQHRHSNHATGHAPIATGWFTWKLKLPGDLVFPPG